MKVEHLCSIARQEQASNPVWTRGVALLPPDAVLPPLGTSDDFERLVVAPGCLGINAFIDGSGMCPKIPALRRCGWSVVFVEIDGSILQARYGPLPLWSQTVPCSELFALWQCVAICAEETRIHCDCSFVVNGFAMGAKHPANLEGLHANLWSKIFEVSARKKFHVVKVAAHTTDEDVRCVRIEAEVRRANETADTLAKQGARLHAAPPTLEREHLQANALVTLVCSYLAKVVVLSTAHCDMPSRKRFYRRNRETAKQSRSCIRNVDAAIAKCNVGASPISDVHVHVATNATVLVEPALNLPLQRKHRPFPLDGGLCCMLCLHKASTKDSIANFIYRPCPGSVLLRVGTQVLSSNAPDTEMVAKSHHLAITGSIVWCKTCGLYAESRIRSLSLACDGLPSKKTSTGRSRLLHLDRLATGIHPLKKHVLPPVAWPEDIRA